MKVLVIIHQYVLEFYILEKNTIVIRFYQKKYITKKTRKLIILFAKFKKITTMKKWKSVKHPLFNVLQIKLDIGGGQVGFLIR